MGFCKPCYKEKINSQIKDEDLSYELEEAVCESCGELKHLVKLPELAGTNIASEAECNLETQKHIENVRKYIRFITDKLTQRGVDHDASKMSSPELELFAQYTKKLASLAFGSDEYTECLANLKPALDHHYAINRHHPEHFPNGLTDMNLIDIIEMFCDWKAASLRQNDGNLLKSIEVSAERFNIDPQLKQIFINTANLLDE